MNKKHRIFIAINLPSDVKKVLASYQKKWPDLPATWTSIENLHITLVFLGDLTDVELGNVCVAVKDVAKKHNSFNVVLNKIAYGPEDKIPPRYIWVGGESDKDASLIKRDLEDVLSEVVRFTKDARAFNLHITLARISAFLWRQIEPEERPEITQVIEIPFTVESVEVMESESVRGNLRYTVIESHQLSNPTNYE